MLPYTIHYGCTFISNSRATALIKLNGMGSVWDNPYPPDLTIQSAAVTLLAPNIYIYCILFICLFLYNDRCKKKIWRVNPDPIRKLQCWSRPFMGGRWHNTNCSKYGSLIRFQRIHLKYDLALGDTGIFTTSGIQCTLIRSDVNRMDEVDRPHYLRYIQSKFSWHCLLTFLSRHCFTKDKTETIVREIYITGILVQLFTLYVIVRIFAYPTDAECFQCI